MMFLLPARIWAVSWAQTLSSKENIAKFCFRDIKGSSFDLEIKHNIDIVLPLFEINKYIEYNEMWHGQIDLSEIYEIKFPEEWKCQTLLPLWYVKTSNELQEFFKNKTKSKLSDQVSHNCRINEKQIDGRELEGKYILELRKHSRKTFKKKSSYRYTQEFNAKVIGRCPEKKARKVNICQSWYRRI